jgi:hypothetical protein
MPDDKTTTGPPVESVNIHEPDDVRNWAKRLDVHEDQLKETIKEVGTSVNAIKKALTGRAIRKP